MDRFLREHPESFVSGTVEDQRRFYDRYEHVVLLTAPVADPFSFAPGWGQASVSRPNNGS